MTQGQRCRITRKPDGAIKPFIQKRWDKIEPAVKAADKRYSHGDIMLDQVLRSIGYDNGRLRVQY